MIFLSIAYPFPVWSPEPQFISPPRDDAPVTGVILSGGEVPSVVFGPQFAEPLVPVVYDFDTRFTVLGPPGGRWEPDAQYRLATDIESAQGFLFETGPNTFPAATVVDACIGRFPAAAAETVIAWRVVVEVTGDAWGWSEVSVDGRPTGFGLANTEPFSVSPQGECAVVRGFHADGRVAEEFTLCHTDDHLACPGVVRPQLSSGGCSSLTAWPDWTSWLARR